MTPADAPNTPYESILESAPPETPEKPAAADIADLIAQIQETAEKLGRDAASRGDAKLLSSAVKELRYCFKVFAEYRGTRKVTIFGSARTQPNHPAYQAAVAFGQAMAAEGFMVITGAAAGIMEAGHLGAGRDNSFGLNILLPFEQAANPVILDDPKLMNLRYFFTRKLVFIKESDAVALFPGGFGTHDEAFEALTLIQTGKSHIFPLVLIDEPGGDYWRRWDEFIDDGLLRRGYISPEDKSLYRITDNIAEAVAEVTRFYAVYHSMRYVRGELVIRLRRPLTEGELERIRTDFPDVLSAGTIEQTAALPQEANEPALAELPRLRFRFNRQLQGRLRQLIDAINANGA
jgi:uncharacterized protein (TIGR00730 family)